ncbi:MAG: methionyl-tRNA formyltransferase [Propionibacteriaceae bacterium]|nr:methionyl-tRNA formyltransferase [Propionibacteriaceae bacterium]
MRVLFAGTPTSALPTLHALLDAGHDVVAVASNPDAPSGRGRHLAASPVAAEAQSLGLPLLQPAKAREPWFVDAVKDLAPDVAVIVAWGCLIPDSLLDVPTHGWVNVHFSLLPAWRGAAPVQRAIMAGDKVSGVTTFELVHDLDAGPVYRQVPVEIAVGEAAGELLDRLAVVGADALVATLDDIASGVKPTPQPLEGVSLAPKVTSEEARIDWTRPAAAIVDQVRGVTPQPGAWTTLNGTRLKVGRARISNYYPPSLGWWGPEGYFDLGFFASWSPGSVVEEVYPDSLIVGTGEGKVMLMSLQTPGKAMMDAVDWARGVRLPPKARFE